VSVRCLGFFPRHLILVSRFAHFHVHPRATRINIVNGTTTKPTDTEVPVAPTEPAEIAATADSTVALQSQAMWQQYNICMNKYHHLVSEYNRRNTNWNDANSQVMGIFNRALDIGIWDQIKDKTAKTSWEWLKAKYVKQSHLEVLEHFRFMKDQKFDLSDPNPQIATFMHHFQALPDKFVSPAMACLILLSNLPLTTNPGQALILNILSSRAPILAARSKRRRDPSDVEVRVRVRAHTTIWLEPLKPTTPISY